MPRRHGILCQPHTPGVRAKPRIPGGDVNFFGGILLFLVAVVCVYAGVQLGWTSKTHLDAGTERASWRKWISLLLIISGFFATVGGILMISS
jgi:hypothetical protein